MRLREKTAWVLVVGLLVALGTQAIRARETRLEAAGHLYECGNALVACNERCIHAGEVVQQFGDRIVECVEDICPKNGWTKPPDWEEELEAAREGRAP